MFFQMKKNRHYCLHVFPLLIVFILFFGMRAEGALRPLPLRCEAPQWLNNSIHGSMSAVWRELMGSRVEYRASVEALALVASRLFTGFSVRLAENGVVFLKPEKVFHWSVSLVPPDGMNRLPDECQNWLSEDLERVRPRALNLLEGVPPEALRWSADSFKAQVDSLVEELMPGWRTSIRVQLAGTNAELEMSFYPQPPLMLALSLETLSSTVPQLLADKMSDKTLEYLSPLTGFPVSWLKHHQKQLLSWLSSKQLENNWLYALRAKAENTINLKTVTKVTSQIDSTKYSLRGWVAVHAGSDARLQAGIHLGHFFSLARSVPAEVYAEMVLGLKDWHVDGRLGLRFSPVRNVWLGVEGSTEEESKMWYRLHAELPRSGFYGWLRYSKDHDLESAVGYHMNRYISLELYYESKHKDRFSLRALSNL